MPSSINLKLEEALGFEHLQTLYDEMKQRAENAERKYDEEKKLRMRTEHKLQAQIMFLGDEHNKLVDQIESYKAEISTLKEKVQKAGNKLEIQDRKRKRMEDEIKDERRKRMKAEKDKGENLHAGPSPGYTGLNIVRVATQYRESLGKMLGDQCEMYEDMKAQQSTLQEEIRTIKKEKFHLRGRIWELEDMIAEYKKDPRLVNGGPLPLSMKPKGRYECYPKWRNGQLFEREELD